MNGNSNNDNLETARDIIDRVGYNKAVRELCNEGICVSRAQARRLVSHVKIQNGDREVKDFCKSRSEQEKRLRMIKEQRKRNRSAKYDQYQ